MTLKHLRVFVAVCEHGGITKAAIALHMVQPAVSTSIAELEKYYNATLFDRINQRLIITELGKELLNKAKNVLADFADFEQSAEFGGQNPKVCIGSSLTLGKTVLPAFLWAVKQQLPQLKLSFVIDKASVIEEKLECGEIDFGIVEGEVRSAHLKKIPFGEDHLIAVCAPDYPVADQLTLEELIQYPLLLREKGSASRNLFDHLLSERHLIQTPLVESISNEALIAFLEMKHGISVLPEGIVENSLKSRTLRAISVTNTPLTRTHYLIMHKNKRLNTVCQSAIALLKTCNL